MPDLISDTYFKIKSPQHWLDSPSLFGCRVKQLWLTASTLDILTFDLGQAYIECGGVRQVCEGSTWDSCVTAQNNPNFKTQFEMARFIRSEHCTNPTYIKPKDPKYQSNIDIGRCGMSANETTLHPSHQIVNLKVNYYRWKYGLQHKALAYTEQQATFCIKGPTHD